MSFRNTDEKNVRPDLIETLIERKEHKRAQDILLALHPVDIAMIMDNLPSDISREVFSLLSPQLASEIILELADESRERILDDLESTRVGEIVDLMPSDDAADLIGVLPEDEANKVLDQIHDEDTKQVRSLLAYDEDTAGGIMQSEVAQALPDMTVQETIAMLRERSDDMDDVHNIFVTDRHHKLMGALPIRKLVLEPASRKILDIMNVDYTFANVDEDQEEIARLFKKYDLISLPVVDDRHCLVGRITIDDIIDVMEEEASEDIFRLAGAGSNDALQMSTVKNTKNRLPWLFASCIGGIVALKIIGAFEDALARVVALASFMPVILGMGGNVGTQSTTIIVRGLATGSVDLRTTSKVVYKEIKVGLLLGLFYGFFLATATKLVYTEKPMLSVVVGLSLCFSMVFASAVGSVTPILLHKAGVDPAVATGPFVTTSMDIMGILIFFNMATFLLF